MQKFFDLSPPRPSYRLPKIFKKNFFLQKNVFRGFRVADHESVIIFSICGLCILVLNACLLDTPFECLDFVCFIFTFVLGLGPRLRLRLRLGLGLGYP